MTKRLSQVRAASYRRVSSDEQAKEGYSLLAQKAWVEEYAEREGWELNAAYEDAGWSGRRADRPEYRRMLDDAAAGRFDVLLVWRRDRLGRDLEERIAAEAALARAKVRLVSTEGEIDEDDPMAPLLRGLHAGIAEMESRLIGKRTSAGLREVAASGRQPCGQPPLGYRAVGEKKERRWIVEPGEAELVRKTIGLYLSGTGINTIARVLNEEGYRTRRGNRFSARVILDMLDNPAYVGAIRLKGEILATNAHPPILADDTYEAVQRLRQAKRELPQGGRGRPPKRHLLAGLLYCPNGHRMIPRSNANGWEHYRCVRRHTYGDCPAPAVSRRQVDEAIRQHFEALNFDAAATKAALAEAAERRITEARTLAHTADRQEQEAEAALVRVRADYKAGHIEADEWRSFREELEEERDAARQEAALLRQQAEAVEAEAAALDSESELAERLAAIREAVAGKIETAADLAALRATLTATFERIIVGSLDQAIPVPDGAPVSVTASGLVLLPIPRPEIVAAVEPATVRLKDGTLVQVELPASGKTALRLETGDEAESSAKVPSPPGRPCQGARRS